jgi:hypothetical protein
MASLEPKQLRQSSVNEQAAEQRQREVFHGLSLPFGAEKCSLSGFIDMQRRCRNKITHLTKRILRKQAV